MNHNKLTELFREENLNTLFPKERSDDFFEALFGDAAEGAYDISLIFDNANNKELRFNLHLLQRPGCCLVCSLTQGLPHVFSRHPVINIQGVVNGVNNLLGNIADCGEWQLHNTISTSSELHIIPLVIQLTFDN